MVHADDATISRRDGFLQLWQSIYRPAEPEPTKFNDLPDRPDNGSFEIDYAAGRGIIDDDEDAFHPDDPLDLGTALVWLFRTRNVADPDDITEETLPDFLERYPVASIGGGLHQALTEAELSTIMQLLDQQLTTDVHEVSLYSEKFHGKGTAFGESFDMYAMTAAHRTFPHNTLVKVTNVENGKSVTVRINDRGPYVEGRDMDLSLGAFTTIADRSKGKINVTFERLGDARLVSRCAEDRPRQQRITRTVRLSRGVPHTQPVNEELRIEAEEAFVVRGIRYPDGNSLTVQDWILPGESFAFTPATVGRYGLVLQSPDGHRRIMETEVMDCVVTGI